MAPRRRQLEPLLQRGEPVQGRCLKAQKMIEVIDMNLKKHEIIIWDKFLFISKSHEWIYNSEYNIIADTISNMINVK